MTNIIFGPFVGEIHPMGGILTMRVFHISDPETTLTNLDLSLLEYVDYHPCVCERVAQDKLVYWITHGDTNLCDDLKRFFNNPLHPNYRANRAAFR